MSRMQTTRSQVADGDDSLIQLSPLDFALWDEQQKSAIYVEGGEIAHKLTVAIWNKDPGKRPVVLEPHAGKPAKPHDSFFADHHHLELRFPRGTLSTKAIAWMHQDLDRLLANTQAPAAEDWYVFHCQSEAGHYESLFLLSPSEKVLELANTETETPVLEIVLAHIATGVEADGLVLPIELRPGPLAKRQLAKDQLDPNRILGARINTVEVLSQLGKKYIPLHFDVVGSNTVLNDGSEEGTSLLLRITNIDREEPIPIARKGHLQTRFILACEITDRGGHQEWALTDEASKVKVWLHSAADSETVAPDPDKRESDTGFGKDWPIGPLPASTNGRMVEWVIDGRQIGTDMLKPNDSVYLRLNVQTKLRSGLTDIHLHYRHIPGYWDGSRVCTIRKSPLIFHRPRASIRSTDSLLSLFSMAGFKSDVLVLELSSTRGGTKELKDFARKLNDQVDIWSCYAEQSFIKDLVRGHGFNDPLLPYSSFHLIYAKGQEQPDSKFAPTDESRSRELDQLLPQLVSLLGFNPLSGEYVGIGTNQPASKLSVTDGLTIGADWAAKHQAPAGGLLVQGNVGIGTPTSKLHLAIGDEDTGLKQEGDNQLAFYTGNVERVRIDSDGNVAIGTGAGTGSTDGKRLHVHGGRLQVSDTSGSAVIELKNDKTSNFLFTDGPTGHVHLRSDSTTHHVILQQGGLNQGKVGIGTDSPDKDAMLHVAGRIWDKSGEVMPVGAILPYYGITAPDGWLICDGKKIPDGPEFDDLKKLIREDWYLQTNGSWQKGSYTPDLRGRFLRGMDGGSGNDPDLDTRTKASLNAKVGAVGSVQEDAVKDHTHKYDKSTGWAESEYEKDAGGLFWGGNAAAETELPTKTLKTESRPKNIYVNFIIKY